MIDHKTLLELTGDQIKYFEFSLRWPDILCQKIPFGFPLFLRVIPIAALPYVTLVLWGYSLGFLTRCLARCGLKKSMILGIVAPLSVSIAMRPWDWHGNPYFYANTERLTAILSAVLFGLVLLEKEWAIGLTTFVMCLIRPAMLFLPPVVFLMKPSWKRFDWLGRFFFGFLVLRLLVVGEFSFCSYGAVQATRIYAMMVERGDLEKVPEKFHPLMNEILNNKIGWESIEYDRPIERDLYHRWYNGDFYARDVVEPYLKTHFKNAVEANTFLRELWTWELRLHWKERLSLYLRALRVALTKIQDPLLVFGLALALWLLMVGRHFSEWQYTIYYLDVCNFQRVLRWVGLWTFFSITTLLLVQFPDDRYMQICFLWLPSMLGCSIGVIFDEFKKWKR